jgi:hypothetical protein
MKRASAECKVVNDGEDDIAVTGCSVDMFPSLVLRL